MSKQIYMLLRGPSSGFVWGVAANMRSAEDQQTGTEIYGSSLEALGTVDFPRQGNIEIWKSMRATLECDL